MKAPKKARRPVSRDAMKVDVAEVMTKKVKTARPETSLSAAMDVMLAREIGHLPVVDGDGVLVGILSKTDLIRERFMEGDTGELERKVSAAVTLVDTMWGEGFHEEDEGRSVSEVMSKRVRTVRADATLAEAAVTMAKHRIHGLPVVSDDDVLVGFLSSLDIVTWVAAN
jgi:CBS domain-containing protein